MCSCLRHTVRCAHVEHPNLPLRVPCAREERKAAPRVEVDCVPVVQFLLPPVGDDFIRLKLHKPQELLRAQLPSRIQDEDNLVHLGRVLQRELLLHQPVGPRGAGLGGEGGRPARQSKPDAPHVPVNQPLRVPQSADGNIDGEGRPVRSVPLSALELQVDLHVLGVVCVVHLLLHPRLVDEAHGGHRVEMAVEDPEAGPHLDAPQPDGAVLRAGQQEVPLSVSVHHPHDLDARHQSRVSLVHHLALARLHAPQLALVVSRRHKVLAGSLFHVQLQVRVAGGEIPLGHDPRFEGNKRYTLVIILVVQSQHN
eukprot:492828-Hanusia_phi.AAC.1